MPHQAALWNRPHPRLPRQVHGDALSAPLHSLQTSSSRPRERGLLPALQARHQRPPCARGGITLVGRRSSLLRPLAQPAHVERSLRPNVPWEAANQLPLATTPFEARGPALDLRRIRPATGARVPASATNSRFCKHSSSQNDSTNIAPERRRSTPAPSSSPAKQTPWTC